MNMFELILLLWNYLVSTDQFCQWSCLTLTQCFDGTSWVYDLSNSRPLKDVLKSLYPAQQNINPVLKHRHNRYPVHHLSPDGSPWILIESVLYIEKMSVIFLLDMTSTTHQTVSHKSHKIHSEQQHTRNLQLTLCDSDCSIPLLVFIVFPCIDHP
jgi:hypothetical protein